MLYFAFIIFCLFFYISYRSTLLALAGLAALLPSYLLRFEIVGLPSTILEVITWAVVLGWILNFVIPSEARLIGGRTEESHALKLMKFLHAPFGLSRNDKKKDVSLLMKRLSIIKYPLVLFLLASVIAIFISPDKIVALGVWRAYFLEGLLVFFLILAVVKDKNDFEKIIFGLSISAFYISIFAIGQRFFGLPIPAPWEKELRVTSIFPYPNAVGLYLSPLILLFLHKIISDFKLPIFKQFSIFKFQISKHLKNTYWIIISILSLSSIIFAQSDGAIIGVAAGIFLFISLNALANKKYKGGAALFLLVLLAGGLLFASVAPIKEKIFLKDWSGFVRRTIWSETWTMLKDNPIFGAGLGGYQEKIIPYHESRSWMEIYLYPHNIILNFWSELGLAGLAGFLWLLEKFYRMCYKLISVRRSKLIFPERSGAESKGYIITALAAMAVLLIHGLVDVPYFKNDLSILFWMIYTMPIICHSRPER